MVLGKKDAGAFLWNDVEGQRGFDPEAVRDQRLIVVVVGGWISLSLSLVWRTGG